MRSVSLIANPRVARLAARLNALGLRPLNRLVKSVAFRASGGKLTVRSRGFVVSGPRESWSALAQIASGSLEPFETQLFEQAVEPGMTVLDVGANIGYYTLIASRRAGPSGHVYAFEPNPETARALRANVRANGVTNVTVIEKAVSDRPGERELILSRSATYAGLYQSMPADSVAGSTPVGAVTIDEALAGATVDVAKMDIEGEEPAALRGMSATIERSPDMRLFVELSEETLAAAGSSALEFIDQLQRAFDEILVIDERSSTLAPFSPSALGRRRNLLCRRTAQAIPQPSKSEGV